MDSPEVSLYLHIPFCGRKCDYCDFYSLPLSAGGAAEAERFKNRYSDALLSETERRFREVSKELSVKSGACLSVPSVYIGGGTPSILGAQGITRLLDGIRSLVGTPREITVEANPETADSAFLSACALHGVTRLSLGIQSFNEALLQAIGRGGTHPAPGALSGTGAPPDKALHTTLSEAAELFGSGLSLDLMSGLPGQSETTLLRDIERALSYKPGHISLYALSVEEGTPLERRLNRNGKEQGCSDGVRFPRGEFPVQLPREEDAERLWLAGRDALKAAGCDHYEVSNFALTPAARSVHNIRYWRMRNWLGIGPAASGTIIDDNGRGRRQSYVPDAGQFCSAVENGRVPPLNVEELDKDTVLKETLLMGYRYCDGPDKALFVRRFGKTIEETIPKTLARWRSNSGNVSGQQTAGQKAHRGNRTMNETIMNFLNRFLLDAFSELDSRPARNEDRRSRAKGSPVSRKGEALRH